MISLAATLAALLCVPRAAGEVQVVRTAQELARALSVGAEHVVVAEHLDLTALPAQRAAGGLQVHFVVPRGVRSVTGNCTGPPPAGLRLDSFAPPQCVLLTRSVVFRFTEQNATLWLDHLHFHADASPQCTPTFPLLNLYGIRSDVWVTASTFQGTGGLVQGIGADSVRTYIGDTTFRGLRAGLDVAFSLIDSHIYSTTAFDGVLFANNTALEVRARACDVVPAGIVGVSVQNTCNIYSGITLRGCTFRDNVGTPIHREGDFVFSDMPLELVSDRPDPCAPEVEAADTVPDYDAYREYPDEGYECAQGAFAEHASSTWAADDRCRALWLSMYEEENYNCGKVNKTIGGSRPLSDLPTTPTAWRPWDFLGVDDPAFRAIVQGREDALVANPEARAALEAAGVDAAGAQAADDQAAGAQQEVGTQLCDLPVGGDSNVPAIVGSVVGAVVFLAVVAAACALLLLRWRRRRRSAPETPSQASSIEMEPASRTLRAFTVPVEARTARSSTEHTCRLPASAATTSAPESGHTGLSIQRRYGLLGTAARDSSHASDTAPEDVYVPRSLGALERQLSPADLERVRGTPPGNTGGTIMLECVLDRMSETRERFAGRFWVHDHMFRRSGGQGIVQFVQRCQDGAEFAVKFFLAPGAYESELAYYQNPALREILVPVAHSEGNGGGVVRSKGGYVFPPFIIVERGESLSEWVSRVATDLPTTMFVLLQLAEKVERLHSNGLCHRDIKPSNVLFLPGTNAWTLMDFGCAAPIGDRARLAYSIHYAAPEVILAGEAGERDMVVTGALDMWSLGVIAVELLTGRRLFPPLMSERAARNQLAGRVPLPWEDPARQQENTAQLKVLRRSVLKCLHRDPAQRPTSRELLGLWNGLFESVTSGTRADYVVPERRVLL